MVVPPNHPFWGTPIFGNTQINLVSSQNPNTNIWNSSDSIVLRLEFSGLFNTQYRGHYLTRGHHIPTSSDALSNGTSLKKTLIICIKFDPSKRYVPCKMIPCKNSSHHITRPSCTCDISIGCTHSNTPPRSVKSKSSSGKVTFRTWIRRFFMGWKIESWLGCLGTPPPTPKYWQQKKTPLTWMSQEVGKWLHPWNLTWNLKRSPWKRWFILETIIFRFHDKFRGCT